MTISRRLRTQNRKNERLRHFSEHSRRRTVRETLTSRLMELGATVCLPNGAPRCGGCPVQHLCRGLSPRSRGCAAGPRREKGAAQWRSAPCLLVRCGEVVGIRGRDPKTGLLAGLWELPSLEGQLSARTSCARRLSATRLAACEKLLSLRGCEACFHARGVAHDRRVRSTLDGPARRD